MEHNETFNYDKLNKFLSYIHMGNEVFRVYYKHSEKIKSEELKKLVVEIQEEFKKHEEKITNIIKEEGYEPVDSLTLSGKMGVFMEQLKIVDDEFLLALEALKAVNMGEVSALKFLNEHENMNEELTKDIKEIISDYDDIKTKIKEFIFQYCD